MILIKLATAIGLVSSFTAAVGTEAHAFVSIRSGQSGAVVRWNEGAQLTVRTNTANSSGLSPSDLFSIFTTSLNRWKRAAFNGFSFTYYQGTDSARYPNYTGSSGDSSIFFTSGAASADQLQCGTIGLTQLWYDPSNGIANKADMRFNDKCFTFTMNPQDTKTQSRIYLGDVVTHELGHALGLDHSENLQSTMIFTAAVNMAKPACDDQAGMIKLYGSSTRGRTGTISGQASSPSGNAIFGAHVTAISIDRGTAMASTLSDKDGNFQLSGLEQGSYALMVEPYYPGSNPLSTYYSGISASVCNGANFERTFSLSGSRLSNYPVSSGRDTPAGRITVNCSAPTSASGGQEASMNTAPELARGPIELNIGATQSVLSEGRSHYYKLAQVSGRVEADALAYSLFSPADLKVELLDASGRLISQQSAYDNVFSSASSGYVNYDAAAVADVASPQDLYVRVTNRGSISSSNYPSRSIGMSSTPYYVLAINKGSIDSPIYPLHARCEQDDSFPVYANQGEAPALPSKNSRDDDGAAGCGTISPSGGSSGPGDGGKLIRLGNFFLLAAFLYASRRLARPATPSTG